MTTYPPALQRRMWWDNLLINRHPWEDALSAWCRSCMWWR